MPHVAENIQNLYAETFYLSSLKLKTKVNRTTIPMVAELQTINQPVRQDVLGKH